MEEKELKNIEERITDDCYVEELPEDYIEVESGTEGTMNLESENIE